MTAERRAWPHVVHRDGRSWVEGTQVPVHRLWAWWSEGAGDLPVAKIARRYPQIKPAALLSALAFAADHRDLIEQDLAEERTRARGMAT